MQLSMRLLLLVLGVLLLASAVEVPASGMSDEETCAGTGTADERTAACTRAITSGQLSTVAVAATYYNRGIAWKQKGDSDKAIADYNEAIRHNPQYALAYNNRGNAWQQKGDNGKALADFNEAIRLNPHDPFAYYNRGIAWGNKGDYDKAIADYKEAIRLNPQFAPAYYNRGDAWDQKGDNDKAIADYNEAIRLNPQYAPAYYNRGNAWKQKGDNGKAIADFNEAIRLNPHDAPAYFDRGIAWFNKGDFSSAASDITQSQQLKPGTYAAIWLYLARTHGNSDAKTELTMNTRVMDGKKWPAPVVALYLGKADSDTVISQAADPDAQKHTEQLCEANFYVGEWHLLRKEEQQARMFLTKAQNECPKAFREYTGAVSELQRLK